LAGSSSGSELKTSQSFSLLIWSNFATSGSERSYCICSLDIYLRIAVKSIDYTTYTGLVGAD